MTTASLSGLLTRVGSLTDADVRELEKLADSYPYCQTAHLLLAKALHDRGAVLAGQKLRRAATGAPDRRALRRLLLVQPVEHPADEAAKPVAASEATMPPSTAELPLLAVSEAGELVSHEAPELELPQPEPVAIASPALPEASAPDVAVEVEAPPEVLLSPAAIGVGGDISSVAPADEYVAPELATDAVLAEPSSVPTTVLADFDLVPDTSPTAVELLLFEADEHAAPAGLSLLAPVVSPAPATSLPTWPPLAPDPAIAYWLPSSRLGAELTAADFTPPTADGVSDPAPAAELTQPWLPSAPADARWVEHISVHQPAPPPAARRPFDHQFALIDRFLREKPRLRAVDPTRPLPDKLPDLALKSTRPDEGGVVSESIARILARQGKTARAVAMYEQLQARLPEKAAIFAAQIAALRGPAANS